ncbi:MAG: DNA topoisomerase (ATP-hydrolyzing) subunit B [Patescibacteria group bacterium]
MSDNKKPKQENNYTAKSIQVLEGLEPVRKRPGMYIGGTSPEGLHHLIWEVVNNSVDEAMAGYCKNIEVKMLQDNVVEVTDDGRGIPVEKHPQTKKSTLETVLTILHAGGKFGGDGYKISGGLHGVGVSVVNALSVWTKAEVKRDGKIYSMEFERGKPKTKDPEVVGKSTEVGTKISFKADPQIFPVIEYNWEKVLGYVRQQAYLTKGVSIKVFDKREKGKERSYGFLFDGGLISYIKFLNRRKEIKNEMPFYAEKKVEDTLVEVALQYTDGYKEHIFSFANNIFTPEGGTHEAGFRAALTRVMNNYAKKNNYLKEKDESFTAEDLQEGLTAVISVKLKNPQFEGQTKAKLGNSEMRGIVSSITAEALADYLEAHPNNAKAILEKCLLTAKSRIAARAAKDAVIRKGALEGMTLPGKLADCSSKNPAESELYIVEGDSAGGCFDGKTEVALVDGRNLSFLELIEEEKKNIKNYCYAIKEDDSVGIGEIKNVRKTKHNAEVIKIILDNDEELVCTPDHLFMLRSCKYKKAKNLTEKDSLMPLYRQFSRLGKRITIEGYEMIFNPAQLRWIFTHMLADKYNLEHEFYQENAGSYRHHVDFNKRNNNPNNLIRLNKEDHLEIHRQCVRKTLQRPDVLKKLKALRKTREYREKISNTMLKPKTRKMLSERAKKQWENKEYKNFMAEKFLEFYNSNSQYREKNNKSLNVAQKKYWSSEENKQKQAARARKYFEKYPEQKKQLSEIAKKQWQNASLLKWRKEKTTQQWTRDFRVKRKIAYNQTYLQKALKVLHDVYKAKNKINKIAYDKIRKESNDKNLIKYETIRQRFFGGSEKKLQEAAVHFNHRIKSIEKIAKKIDVYDLEVPNAHNFALASGIFVHNSAKQGRNRKFQAILPLRGKLVNVEKTTLDKVVKSDTLKPIIIALGAGIGNSFDIEKLRYHRIIIMADADVDGSHIRTLLLTFFYRYYEELITRGYIYIAQPPLYRIQKSKDVRFAYTEEEKNKIINELKKSKIPRNNTLENSEAEIIMETDESESEVGEKIAGINIQRYKGLGEMNPEQLWETTMDPERRVMRQVKIEDATSADRVFDILMGSDVEPRRRFIQTHAKSVKNLDI